MPEAEIHIREVRTEQTRGGSTRFVVVDSAGREYATFREEVAASVEGGEGRRARIRYHEQQRGRFTNVYLDSVELLGEQPKEAAADEIAWKTAIDAAPYLLSADAVEQETPAEEVFEKLQPFKELVADDIEAARDGEDDS